MTRHEAIESLVDLHDRGSLRLKAAEHDALGLALEVLTGVDRDDEDRAVESYLLEELRAARRDEGLSADGAAFRLEGLVRHASDLGRSPSRLLRYLAAALEAREAAGVRRSA